MRLSRKDLVPVLAIVASGAVGLATVASLVLRSPPDNVSDPVTVVAPSATVESEKGCESGEGTELVVLETDPVLGGGTIQYWTKPHFVCADGVDIWADSAVTYSAQSMSHLMGAVRYVDRTRELLADEARYFADVGRLQAEGNVFVRENDDGPVVEGESVTVRTPR